MLVEAEELGRELAHLALERARVAHLQGESGLGIVNGSVRVMIRVSHEESVTFRDRVTNRVRFSHESHESCGGQIILKDEF